MPAPHCRPGFHSITPYLQVTNGDGLLEFVKKAFNAKETYRSPRADGSIRHAEFRIGDSMVEMADGSARFPALPAAIHLYVPDAAAVYQQALQAGAESLYGPVQQAYGDRESAVVDLCENTWYIATHTAAGPHVYAREGMRTVTPYLHTHGTANLIAFLKHVFDATEDGVVVSGEGVVRHARIRIGDSIIEMGEARAEWPPMPAAIHVYVDDADAVYARALAIGAKPLIKPANQNYGDRLAGVTDAGGNIWYIAAHLGASASASS